MQSLCLLLLLASCRWVGVAGRRNFIHIVLDDAGLADFQQNDPWMRTANISWLREEGVYLTQSYAHPMCVPTRAALMTGRYAHTLGAQDVVAMSPTNNQYWIDENLTFLPQALKDQGYQTHMVGKWHLGTCHPGLRPLGRGFDTFYGMLLGAHRSYYSHTKRKVYDFYDGENVDFSAKGHYKTELFTDRAVEIIRGKRRRDPFYMYLSYASPHSPLEVPEAYIRDHCSQLTGDRQTRCGMMAAVDTGVGRVVQALKDRGIYEKTTILLSSDNGGAIKLASSNYPLRGSKKGVYEGGTRVYTVLKDSRLAPNSTWEGLAHVIDWYPTIMTMLGLRRPRDVHGKTLFRSIRSNKLGPRRNFIYDVNDYWKNDHVAFRYSRRYKLIIGDPGLQNGWYPPYYLISGNVTTVDIKGSELGKSNRQLFDLIEDPYEQHNLYYKKWAAKLVRRITKKLNENLGVPGKKGRYPLQPLYLNKTKSRHVRQGNVFKPCFCDPPSLRYMNVSSCPTQSDF